MIMMVTEAYNQQQFYIQRQQEIGRAVSKWKSIYNKNHGRVIINILQEYLPLYLHNC